MCVGYGTDGRTDTVPLRRRCRILCEQSHKRGPARALMLRVVGAASAATDRVDTGELGDAFTIRRRKLNGHR